VTGRGEIGLRELRSLRPLAPGDARAETHAIGAGGRAEYARDARAPKTGERIVAGAFFKRGDGADRGREQRDLAWEHVAEQAGNAQRHVDPRPPQHRERQDLEAADAGGRWVPDRPAAEEREGLREIVAAGAHGRRSPEVEHDALRPFAVVLRVALEDLVGGAAADLPGVAGRGRTRIDGVEIAAGRQNVEPATRGRAGRPWRNKASAKRAQEAKQFGGAACGYALGQSFFLRLLSDRSGGKEALGALRRAAEYVEAVTDAHVLQVAEPGVEGDQGLIGRLAVGGAFLDEAALFSPLENERRNDPRAARIKRLRLGELVEQAFELERGPVRSGGGQRRRHVSDRHRADAALGLRRLARVVDDERIHDRGRADEHFRGAALAERNRLARQPFQRAMRAELNDCVDFFAAGEPEVEGDVAVPRRQVEIVIVALARRRVAAVGLDGDDELAELNEAEGEG